MNINEIANLAGVSRTTVSRLLHGGYVSESARQRIEKIIEQTGYQPNVQAQAFRMGTSHLVGIILPSLDSELVRTITESMMMTLENAGYQTIAMRYGGDTQRIPDQILQLKSRGVDGLIIFLVDTNAEVDKALIKAAIPAVTIGSCTIEGIAGVCHDDALAFEMLTQMAVDAGYTKIGALIPDPTSQMSQIRMKAIQRTILKNKLFSQPEWFICLDLGKMAHQQYGIRLGQAALALKDRPQVFLAAADRIAYEAATEIKRAGLSIPNDIAIAGAGNSEVGALMLPALTTVDMNAPEIALQACASILNQMLNRQPTAEIGVVTPMLIRRESM